MAQRAVALDARYPNAHFALALICMWTGRSDRAVAEFEAAIDRLDAELAGSCLLRVIGPLPPYTFGTFSITRFDAERLAAGRALLGLAGEISEQAVLSSYRRLARQSYPDGQPDGTDAAQRFTALNAARTYLLAYALSRARVDTPDGPALMVTIGPSEQDGASR